ncbi:DUF998 domain-containing protein [Phytomonospora sp. NPDC050363]|uniref:DUF998 domain-containing protein n=1 Tax=Phytomonospora sp. NPDC050363 TaxID=3155642 RepID=UPI0033C152A5
MTAGMWTGESRTVARVGVVTRTRPAASRIDLVAWLPPRLGIAACFAAMLCMGYLHLVPSDVDALSQPVSSYVRVGGGWLFTIGVSAMAVACFAVAAARLALRGAGLLRAVFAIGGVAFLAAAVFPTDSGEGVLSLSAEIHRWAAGVGMGAIPAGGLLLALGLGGAKVSNVARRVVPLVTVSAVLLMITATGTFLPDFVHSGDWRGVPQRALLFTEITLVLVIAFVSLARARRAEVTRS